MEILSLGIIPFAFAGCRFRPSGQVKHARKLINDGENSRRAARSFGVDYRIDTGQSVSRKGNWAASAAHFLSGRSAGCPFRAGLYSPVTLSCE
jgi:hypothetical protein